MPHYQERYVYLLLLVHPDDAWLHYRGTLWWLTLGPSYHQQSESTGLDRNLWTGSPISHQLGLQPLLKICLYSNKKGERLFVMENCYGVNQKSVYWLYDTSGKVFIRNVVYLHFAALRLNFDGSESDQINDHKLLL